MGNRGSVQKTPVIVSEATGVFTGGTPYSIAPNTNASSAIRITTPLKASTQ
jgi:hypothetical protein